MPVEYPVERHLRTSSRQSSNICVGVNDASPSVGNSVGHGIFVGQHSISCMPHQGDPRSAVRHEHREPRRLQSCCIIVHAQSTQPNGFDGSVFTRTNEDENFDLVEVAHKRFGCSMQSRRHSRLNKKWWCFHSVCSGDFMLREVVVVVLRSVSSGDLRDGWSCGRAPVR